MSEPGPPHRAAEPAPPPRAAEPGSEPPADSPSRRGALLRNGLHLFALSGLAFAQPLFNLLEGDPSSLIIDGATGAALLLLALMLLLVPPALLLALEALASLAGVRVLRIVHLVFVGALVALFVFQARTSIDALPDGTNALTLIAAAVAALGVFLYARFDVVRRFVGVLAFAPPVFAALFLLAGPASPLLTAADPPPAKAATIPADAPPVVMLIFDELPLLSLLDAEGDIDAERYPNFGRLARDGTWFKDITAVDGSTPWAVPAIMDGNRPRNRRVAAAGYHPHSIFALLGGRYRMHVQEVVTRVCPRRLCPRDDPAGIDGAWHAFGALNSVLWDRLLPPALSRAAAKTTYNARKVLGANDPDTINDKRIAGVREFVEAVNAREAAFRRFVSEIEDTPKPSFHFMHLLYPHGPWEHLPSGRRYKETEPDKEGLDWIDSQVRVDTVWQAHLLQVKYTDRLLGQVLDRLDAEGMYDRALIAITADHGASFHAARPFRYPTPESMPTVAPIPFIVKAPGQTGGEVVTTPLETIDELPTIADALEIELPWKTDGASGFGEARAGTEQASMSKFGKDPQPIPRSALNNAAVLRERVSLSGAGSDLRPLFAARGFGDVVGLKVPAGLPSHPEVRARLDTPEAWDAVDLDADFVPAWVVGTLAGNGEPGRLLAIAIGGRVAAVSRSWPNKELERFTAIVSDENLRPGRNEVDVYLLRPGRHDLRGAVRIGGN